MINISSLNKCSVNFSANSNEYKQKNSHAGLYCGVGVSAVPALFIASADRFGKRFLEPLDISVKITNRTKYAILPMLTAVNIACGVVIDKLIKDKQSEFSRSVEGLSTQDAVEKFKRGKSTEKGNPYYCSNIGKIFGMISGLVLCPLSGAISSKSLRGVKSLSLLSILGLAGGAVLGSFADSRANKVAAKNADNKYLYGKVS